MIVQACCLPSGVKMLVIPIFFPIIPFIVFAVCAQQVVEDIPPTCGIQSLFANDLFLCFRLRRMGSTVSKQTSKGLFICCRPYPLKRNKNVFNFLFRALFFALYELRDENIFKNFLAFLPFRG